MLELGIKFFLSYLLGSLMGSLIMGRLKGGVDIRTSGSGNAGDRDGAASRAPTATAWRRPTSDKGGSP